MSSKSFYEILFDKDDAIHFKNRRILENGDVRFLPGEGSRLMMSNINPEYICMNPLHLDSDNRATIDNIAAYRTFLIEEDATSVEDQEKKIKLSGLPYSACVFSGNSSYHYTLSLEQPIDSIEEYTAIAKAIRQVLRKYDYNADGACKNVNRLTRAPMGINVKSGNQQDLIEVKSRVANATLFDWIAANGVKIEQPKLVEYQSFDGPDSADDDHRWDVVKKMVAKQDEWRPYDELVDGDRFIWRFKYIIKAKECGLSLDSITRYMIRDFPSSEGTRKNEVETRRIYTTTNVSRHINIMSKADWAEYADRQKKTDYDAAFENLLNEEFGFNGDDVVDETIPEDFPAHLERYIVVGDSIYMIANRKLHKRSMQSFTIWHRKQDLRMVRTYVDFCNEPGYLNYQPVINNYYNSFQLPMWKARDGEWNTIERYLRHISGHQYEMMLDYFQLSLMNPKQKLPILILMSYEKGTGKTIFSDLLRAMFSESNVAMVTPANFELEWNISWYDKHFVFIDEAEKIQKKDIVSAKLKRLAYNKTIEKNKKSHDTVEVPWHGRIVITSNQESGFIDIDVYEDRYWILKVKPYDGMHDGDFVDKMKSEVSHFAYFLQNRTLSTKSEGRGWFNKELLKTEALESIVINSRPQVELDIDRVFTEWFESTDKLECNFLIDELSARLNKYKEPELKDALHRMFNLKSERSMKEHSFGSRTKKQRYWYTVKREWFLTHQEFADTLENVFEAF